MPVKPGLHDQYSPLGENRRRHPWPGCLWRDSNGLGLVRYRSSCREFKYADDKHANEQGDVGCVAVEFIARYRAAWRTWRRDGTGTAAVSGRDIERWNKPKRMMRSSDHRGANGTRARTRGKHCTH